MSRRAASLTIIYKLLVSSLVVLFFPAGPAPAAMPVSPHPLLIARVDFIALSPDDWRMEPVTVPPPPQAGHESLPRVEQILEEREQLDVSTAHEDYPLVPGCKPVAGEISELPLLDQGHHLGSRGICLPAQWVDNFFAEDDDDFHAARTLLRVISFSRLESGKRMRSGTLLNARTSLPHTGERLSLIFRSDDNENDRLSERDDIEDAETTGVIRAALRWAALQTRYLTGHLDGGIRDSAPFVRSRLRFRIPLGERGWTRLSQEFYWRGTEDRRGQATELELGMAFSPDSAVRLNSLAESNTRLRSEDIDWRWSQSASWFVRLEKRSAIQARIHFRGRTRPNYRTDSWQASMRMRRSFWRPWLYYEIEPFLLALREEDFEQVPGLVARLEIQFGAYR